MGGTKKADRLFERWEYYRAAQLYEREAEKRPGADVYYKLGECYRKMNKYKQAEQAYDKVNEYGAYRDADFYLHYGQILNSVGRHDDAKLHSTNTVKRIPKTTPVNITRKRLTS